MEYIFASNVPPGVVELVETWAPRLPLPILHLFVECLEEEATLSGSVDAEMRPDIVYGRATLRVAPNFMEAGGDEEPRSFVILHELAHILVEIVLLPTRKGRFSRDAAEAVDDAAETLASHIAYAVWKACEENESVITTAAYLPYFFDQAPDEGTS